MYIRQCFKVYFCYDCSHLVTAFTRFQQIIKMVKNVTDRCPVHKKMGTYLQADFENRALAGTRWKRHRVA